MPEELEVSRIEEARSKRVTQYITHKYGSLAAFKLLKNFIEHKLARESNGMAVFEIAYNIPPSEVLTRHSLVQIVCRVDGCPKNMAEDGLDTVLKKMWLKRDEETDILELTIPLDLVTNIGLRDTGTEFETVSDRSSADVVILPRAIRSISERASREREDMQKRMRNLPEWTYLRIANGVVGLPDLVYIDKNSHSVIPEVIKFSSI